MILVGTGPLVAAVNRRDARHTECRDLLEQRSGELLVSPYVVAEVRWMEAEANVIDAVAAGELLHRYRDLHGGTGLSAADASTMAAAERLGIREIATLDVTDFTVVRPAYVDHFTLLP